MGCIINRWVMGLSWVIYLKKKSGQMIIHWPEKKGYVGLRIGEDSFQWGCSEVVIIYRAVYSSNWRLPKSWGYPGYPNCWMVYFIQNQNIEWMIWGYPMTLETPKIRKLLVDLFTASASCASLGAHPHNWFLVTGFGLPVSTHQLSNISTYITISYVYLLFCL